MSNVVEVNRLMKSYRKVTAVQDISFKMEANKVYGLLGRNGAGKTTIMKLITAQLFPTNGEIKVFGESPYENSRVLSQVCFVKESQKYPDSFRVIDVLDLSPSFFPNWDREYSYSLLEDFRLPLKQKIKKLSRGMLSALGIVVGLASRAPLTIFDEPYLGLDAVSRNMFYDHLIEDYTAYPRTIILSTHLIDEVSKILEYIMVLDNGNLIVNEETDALRGRAFSVLGPTSRVETFTKGKATIQRQPLGGLTSATIMENLDAKDQMQAETLGLQLSPVSLQDLVIHLTKGKFPEKVENTQ